MNCKVYFVSTFCQFSCDNEAKRLSTPDKTKRTRKQPTQIELNLCKSIISEYSIRYCFVYYKIMPHYESTNDNNIYNIYINCVFIVLFS